MKQGKCERCNQIGHVHKHHLKPRYKGGKIKERWNWIICCPNCHAVFHEELEQGINYAWVLTTKGMRLLRV